MLPLTIAIADYPHTTAIKSGAIPIAGVDASFVTVQPQIAAFRKMVRELAYDVCEMAPTTYLIARAHGVPIVALPIFVMRRFHHSGFVVRPDANIRDPKDLEGKTAGVRAWSVTTGVWTRGILRSEFGVDSARITWFVDDEEHVEALQLPPYVRHVAPGTSLAGMMRGGELAAAFDGNAGIGRSGTPGAGWKQERVSYPELFPDAEEREAEWFARTGIYPMHGTIVVKEEVLRARPWLARALFDAFSRAKTEWLAKLHGGEADTPPDRKYRALTGIVGEDPLPYGMAANRTSLAALEEIAWQERLIPERMPLGEAFVDPEA